jgi:hypothetical protein
MEHNTVAGENKQAYYLWNQIEPEEHIGPSRGISKPLTEVLDT